MWAHFNQHSPTFSLRLKCWHSTKLHHTPPAASECLQPVYHIFFFLALLFIGLEEHLVQKFCTAYTKQNIKTHTNRWKLLCKTLGSDPKKPWFFTAWTSSHQNNSLHTDKNLIWASQSMDRIATKGLDYSKSASPEGGSLSQDPCRSHTQAAHSQIECTHNSHERAKYSSNLQLFPAGKDPPHTP